MKATKAWNGGSIESAMELARRRRDHAIAQGATICDECGGRGGSQISGICIQCKGAGCILPPGGLSLEGELARVLEEWLEAQEEIQSTGVWTDTPRCMKARIAARAALASYRGK
jgi:hypothetical protein